MMAKPRPACRGGRPTVGTAVFAVLILTGLSSAAGPEFEPRFDKLSNGLRICIVEEHSQPLVSVQLWFRAGASVDPPTLPGLSHVALTALVQSTTEPRPPLPTGWNRIHNTLPDANYIALLAGSAELDRCLAWSAAHFQTLKLTSNQLDVARDAAALIWGGQPETMDQRKCRLLLAAMFPNHSYCNPPEFVGERLAGAESGTIEEFAARWFAVGNATLFVIGDITPAIALQKIKERFGSIRWIDVPAPAEHPFPDNKHRYVQAPDSAVTFAWLVPPAGHMDRTIALVAREILRQRLTRQWSSLESSTGASEILSARDGSVIVLEEREPRPHAPVEFESRLTQLARNGCLEFELNRARKRIRRHECEAAFGFENWSIQLAESEMVAGDILLASLAPRQAALVGIADVQRAARELNNRTRRVALIPESGDHRPPPEAPPVPGSPLRPMRHAAATTPIESSRTVTYRMESGRLANGVRWVNCTLPVSGFAQFRLAIHDDGAGRAPQLNWVRPVAFPSMKSFQDFLNYRGLKATVSPEPDGWSVTLDGLREETDAMIELLSAARRYSDGTFADSSRLEFTARGDFTVSECAALAQKMTD